MSAKDKAETRELLRKMVSLHGDVRDFLITFSSDLEDVKKEIEVGSDADYKSVMRDEAEHLGELANAFWVANKLFMRTVAMPLGDLAGNPDPMGDEHVSISMFNDLLVANNEHVASLGITKTALTPDGGNTGDAVAVELLTGADGTTLDCGHHETIKLKCISIGPNLLGQWNLFGGKRGNYLFDDERGTGDNNGGYGFSWGAGNNEFSRATSILRTGRQAKEREWAGHDPRNMVTNGNFAAPLGSGNSKVFGANITSGEAEIEIETAAPIKGAQSLKFTGNAVIEFPMYGVTVGRPEFCAAMVMRKGTATGTLTIELVSGASTSHWSDSLDISTLTADALHRMLTPYIGPAALGTNPRFRVTVASYGGTGSILIDELIGGALSLFDSSRAIAVVQGVTPSRRGDLIEGGNSISVTDGVIQRMFNECFGRGVRHSGSPTYWTIS